MPFYALYRYWIWCENVSAECIRCASSAEQKIAMWLLSTHQEWKWIDNIKYVQLSLTERFGWKFAIGKVLWEIIKAFRRRNAIITFECAQKKYLITEFMDVSPFARNLYRVWLVVCSTWRYGNMEVFNNLAKCIPFCGFFVFVFASFKSQRVCTINIVNLFRPSSFRLLRHLFFVGYYIWMNLIWFVLNVFANLIKIKQSAMKCWT